MFAANWTYIRTISGTPSVRHSTRQSNTVFMLTYLKECKLHIGHNWITVLPWRRVYCCHLQELHASHKKYTNWWQLMIMYCHVHAGDTARSAPAVIKAFHRHKLSDVLRTMSITSNVLRAQCAAVSWIREMNSIWWTTRSSSVRPITRRWKREVSFNNLPFLLSTR